MADITAITKKYLYIEPSAIQVSGELETHRRLIARFASNIWWHLTVGEPEKETYIKAYTLDTHCVSEGITIPHSVAFTKIATIEDLPTFDSVLDYCIELFKQLFSLPIPHFFYELEVGTDKAPFWVAPIQNDKDYEICYSCLRSTRNYPYVDEVVKK